MAGHEHGQEPADSTNDGNDADENVDEDGDEQGGEKEEDMSGEEGGQSESQSSPDDGDMLLEEKLAKVLGGTPRPSSPVKQTPSIEEIQKPDHEPQTEAEVVERLRILELFG